MTDETRKPPSLAAYRPSSDGPLHPNAPRAKGRPEQAGRRSFAEAGRRPATLVASASRPSRAPEPSRRDPDARYPRARRSIWLRLAIWIGGIGAVAAVALFALFAVFSPAELIRDRLVAEVRAATGRTLTIEGAPQLSLIGGASVRLGATSLSAPQDMNGPPLFTTEAVQVDAALWPLISGRIAIERVTLIRPEISLVVDERGRRSWDFASVENVRPSRVRVAQAGPSGATRSDAGRAELDSFRAAASPASREAGAVDARTLAALERLELGEVRITKGIVRYQDRTTGVTEAVSQLDLTLAGRDIKSPVTGRLAFDWRGERISGTGSLDSPRVLLSAGAARVGFDVASQRGKLSGQGGLMLAGAPRFEGPVKLETPSLARLAALGGLSLPNAAPLGAFNGQGRLITDQAGARLEQASIWLGETAASGTVAVAMAGRRPTVTLDLALSALDLDKLSAGLREAAGAAQAAPPMTGQPAPRSINDLLRGSSTGAQHPGRGTGSAMGPGPGAGRFSPSQASETEATGAIGPAPRAPQVRGYTRRLGWSDAPIDVAALAVADVSGRVSLAGLTSGGLKVGETKLRLSLVSGQLTLDIDEVALYEGRARGRLTAAPSDDKRLAVTGALAIDGVLIGQLLADTGGRPAVEGRARLNLAIEGRGGNEQELMASLAGRTDLRVIDGAVTGWDVGRIINGLGEGRLPSPAPDPAARTEFTQLTATFTVADGVARTNDVKLTGPQLTATGGGAIDIGGRSVDLLIHPRVSPNVLAPGSTINIAKLQVPLRVRGPWQKPEVGIEGGRVRLEGQEQLQQRVKEEFRGKSAGDIVEDLLSKGAKSETADKARKLFREFMQR